MATTTLEETETQRDELLERAKGFALAAVTLFSEEELAEALATLVAADAIGWVYDPTAYRDSGEARDRVTTLYRALRAFRSAVETMIEDDVARASAAPIECPTCAAKPGSPDLCATCLRNRELARGGA